MYRCANKHLSPRTQEVQVGRSKVQGHLQLYPALKANLSYMKLCCHRHHCRRHHHHLRHHHHHHFLAARTVQYFETLGILFSGRNGEGLLKDMLVHLLLLSTK